MTVPKQGAMPEVDLNLDIFPERKELDDIVVEPYSKSAVSQERQMQVETPLSEFALGFDVADLFHGETSFPALSVEDNMLTSTAPVADECSLFHTLSVASDHHPLMEISPEPQHSFNSLPCQVSQESHTLTPLFVTLSSDVSPTVISNPVTPTSGPTPVITPINSMPSSPCGSLYSGYSSGWGPPSPPGRDKPRKKRGATRTRARVKADISMVTSGTTTSYTTVTPVISPISSVPTSPTDSKSALKQVVADSIVKDSYQNSSIDGRVPRHKRPSHIRAEHKRRNKIQLGLDDLKVLIPTVSDSSQNGGKESKSAVLAKAVEHCRQLRQETKEGAREIQKLQAELESLTLCINEYQQQLPEEGAGVEVTSSSSHDIKQMFQDYISSRTFGNWKFWIFGMLITPLFESYNCTVSSRDTDQFCASVLSWLDKTCSLVALRPVVFKALRNLSKKTSIMTTPEKLRQEALDDVMKTNFPNGTEIS